MNSKTIDAKLREKLDPHVEAIVDGSSTEYDVFPAVLSTILNKQALLIQNQSDFANLIYSLAGELKVFRESNQESLAEIIRYTNELKISQDNLADVKFGELKLQQDTSFQETSNEFIRLNELTSSLLKQQDANSQEILKAFAGLNELTSNLLKQQKSLESSLLIAQEERKAIKKNAAINLMLSIISIALLSGILFVLLK